MLNRRDSDIVTYSPIAMQLMLSLATIRPFIVADGVLCTAVLPHRHAAAVEFGNHLAFQPLHFCVQRFDPRFYLLFLLL